MGETPEPAAAQPQADPAGDPAAESKTFTQEEVDRIVGDRLGRERSKFADYDDLKDKASKFDELAESQKSELERLTSERDSLKETSATLEQKTADAERRYLRLKVGAEKGLPVSLAERLQGSDEDEMAQDADRLLEVVGGSQPRPSFDGGAREPAEPNVEPGLSRLAYAYSHEKPKQ